MRSIRDWFETRVAVIATMHQKEKAIAPLLTAELGVNIVVPQNFDTDQFGTFTREKKRVSSQIATARLKAQAALELTGETLAIASEGSFFPHPALPLVNCDREIVMLFDQKHNLEIVGQEISLNTNHRHQTIESLEEALTFAGEVGFPAQGLVVMTSSETTDSTQIFKGIQSQSQLAEAVSLALSQSGDGKIHIETDLRAMCNPTRLQVIAQATANLLTKIQQQCPQCFYPGFDLSERREGLPCGLCGFPTSLIKLDIYQCQHCQYQQQRLFPDGNSTADPTYCNFCNP